MRERNCLVLKIDGSSEKYAHQPPREPPGQPHVPATLLWKAYGLEIQQDKKPTSAGLK